MARKKTPSQLHQYPDKWKRLLLNYVRRENQDQGLKAWCESNGLNYSTARDWIRPDTIKQALLEEAALRGVVGEDAESLKALDFNDIADRIDKMRECRKKDVPSIYLDVLPPEEQRIYMEMHATGLDLRNEITFARYQLRRAKHAQIKSDSNIGGGKEQDNLILVEDSTEKGEVKKATDWDTIEQRLLQTIGSLVGAQVKIEFGERLTSDERTDVLARTLRQFTSEKISAFEAGLVLSAAGIERIPVALDLKIKDELKLYEPPPSTDPGVTREQVLTLASQIKEQQEKERETFLKERQAEVQQIISESDDG